MAHSNIIVGSNVFRLRKENPYWDSDYVAQIKDYKLLKYIAKKAESDDKISRLSAEQEQILEYGIRCAYAKNDPCWGIGIKTNKLICTCINGRCPQILKCNPQYTATDASFWTISEEERNRYGEGSKIPYYYIVDLISDDEMALFNQLSDKTGLEYPIHTDTDSDDDNEEEPRYRVDPKSGKKQVIIGYRWKIIDNASYEGEKLFPIWGDVDEIKQQRSNLSIKKAKKIEKKTTLQTKTKDLRKLHDKDFAMVENRLLDHIKADVKISNFLDIINSDKKTVIVFDNWAELAFASYSLLSREIEHSIRNDSKIILTLMDDYSRLNKRENIVISESVLKRGCSESSLKAWELIANKDNIYKLHFIEREYYEFSYGDYNVWTCRNMYGITHISIDKSYINISDKLSDGLYYICIKECNGKYIIKDELGENIGNVDSTVKNILKVLIEYKEIPGFPEAIDGMAIQIVDGKVDFLGMGHLTFTSY